MEKTEQPPVRSGEELPKVRKTSIERKARTEEEAKEIAEYLNIVRSFVNSVIVDHPGYVDGIVGEFSEPRKRDQKSVGVVVRHVVDEHRAELMQMCEKLVVTKENIYSTFRDVAKELFLGDINWGRIVLLIAFTGMLCRHCMENKVIVNAQDETGFYQQLTSWTAEFMHEELGAWINKHNRWVSSFEE